VVSPERIRAVKFLFPATTVLMKAAKGESGDRLGPSTAFLKRDRRLGVWGSCLLVLLAGGCAPMPGGSYAFLKVVAFILFAMAVWGAVTATFGSEESIRRKTAVVALAAIAGTVLIASTVQREAVGFLRTLSTLSFVMAISGTSLALFYPDPRVRHRLAVAAVAALAFTVASSAMVHHESIAFVKTVVSACFALAAGSLMVYLFSGDAALSRIAYRIGVADLLTAFILVYLVREDARPFVGLLLTVSSGAGVLCSLTAILHFDERAMGKCAMAGGALLLLSMLLVVVNLHKNSIDQIRILLTVFFFLAFVSGFAALFAGSAAARSTGRKVGAVALGAALVSVFGVMERELTEFVAGFLRLFLGMALLTAAAGGGVAVFHPDRGVKKDAAVVTATATAVTVLFIFIQ